MAEPRPQPPAGGRRFFVARGARADAAAGSPAPVELAPEEAAHALRVLRLRRGDELLGLDGEGSTWSLRVAACGRGSVEVEPLGPPVREPAPGTPGAPLPRIELAVAWPRGARGEDMLDRLVQLGAAAVTPLAAHRSGPEPAPGPGPGAARLRRLERRAREACKQSRRSWLPTIEPPCTPAELVARREGAVACVLDPAAAPLLGDVARAALDAGAGTPARPLLLVVGPEGGFAPDEHAALAEGGARFARLAPFVLRIETAAEAALAVTAAEAQKPSRVRSET